MCRHGVFASLVSGAVSGWVPDASPKTWFIETGSEDVSGNEFVSVPSVPCDWLGVLSLPCCVDVDATLWLRTRSVVWVLPCCCRVLFDADLFDCVDLTLVL